MFCQKKRKLTRRYFLAARLAVTIGLGVSVSVRQVPHRLVVVLGGGLPSAVLVGAPAVSG